MPFKFEPGKFLTHLFTRIFGVATGFWTAASPFLKSFISTLFSDALAIATEALFPIVSDVLLQIQQDPAIVMNEDRRKTAMEQVKQRIEATELQGRLIALGFKETTGLINFAIEATLQALKNKGLLPENAGEQK